MAWKIAIDAMGGDRGPGPLIQGALLAAAESGSDIILVGDERLLTAEMKEYSSGGLPFEIRHAGEF
jgi:phosphate acyltransferase